MNVADAFDKWWADSFPMAPANRQARENYIAFGGWLLEQQPACPHIVTSNEGTSYCRLAEANSKPTPNDRQIRSSLVERVALAISRSEDPYDWTDEIVNWEPEARAAIREVAAWLIDRRRDDDWLAPFEELADLLLEEAQR